MAEKEKPRKVVAENRRARYDYAITETCLALTIFREELNTRYGPCACQACGD